MNIMKLLFTLLSITLLSLSSSIVASNNCPHKNIIVTKKDVKLITVPSSHARANSLCASAHTLNTISHNESVGKYYLRGGVHNNKMRSITLTEESLTQASKNSPGYHLGLGYRFTDRIRTDVTFNYSAHYFKNNWADTQRCQMNLQNTDIHSIMVSSYVDVLKTKDLNFFLGFGIGRAEISDIVGFQARVIGFKTSANKKVKNVAYSLAAGLDIPVNPSVDFEITYNFRDFGKTNARNKLTQVITSKNYNSHDISASFRYKL